MSGVFTKSMARNIFYGGTVFFFLVFLAQYGKSASLNHRPSLCI